MQRVPKPGASSRAFSSFCMLTSEGASSLKHTRLSSWRLSVGQAEVFWAVPDEGDLVLVHPGLQFQTGILSKRWDDETEDQGDADEDSRKDDLHTRLAFRLVHVHVHARAHTHTHTHRLFL